MFSSLLCFIKYSLLLESCVVQLHNAVITRNKKYINLYFLFTVFKCPHTSNRQTMHHDSRQLNIPDILHKPYYNALHIPS